VLRAGEEPVRVHLICHFKTVDSQRTAGEVAIQCNPEYLSVMESRSVAKPRHKLWATRHPVKQIDVHGLSLANGSVVRNGSRAAELPSPTIGRYLPGRVCFGMARTRQTFRNDKTGPIYVSVEPWPQCFELQPGDKLTLIYDASDEGDALEVSFAKTAISSCGRTASWTTSKSYSTAARQWAVAGRTELPDNLGIRADHGTIAKLGRSHTRGVFACHVRLGK
jgi:hypothetical protein